MPYIPFTEEQKRRAASVDLEEYLSRHGEALLPSGRDKRLAGDHSITVRGNTWYDHAVRQGGGPVISAQTLCPPCRQFRYAAAVHILVEAAVSRQGDRQHVRPGGAAL